jgi:hypothetical protein
MRLEVRDGPDSWGPVVNERREGRREVGWHREMGRKGKQADGEKMGHGESLGRRKREGEKEVGRRVKGKEVLGFFKKTIFFF